MYFFKKFLQLRREVIAYLFWGVMTTVVNYAVYFICTRLLDIGFISANLIAWVFAVLFAYITNKKFVFGSPWDSTIRVVREVVGFISGRIISLLVETLILYFFIEIMLFNDFFVKIFTNVAVVILNYIFAKVLIFRKKR